MLILPGAHTRNNTASTHFDNQRWQFEMIEHRRYASYAHWMQIKGWISFIRTAYERALMLSSYHAFSQNVYECVCVANKATSEWIIWNACDHGGKELAHLKNSYRHNIPNVCGCCVIQCICARSMFCLKWRRLGRTAVILYVCVVAWNAECSLLAARNVSGCLLCLPTKQRARWVLANIIL